MLRAIAAVMLAGAVGLLAYVSKAVEEPFWFYGSGALLAVLAIFLLSVSWRIVRHVRRQR